MSVSVNIKQGSVAPDFSLESSVGGLVRLSDFKGKWVVLYFYPKDNTSGCTTEALEFSGLKADFEALNAVVLGVSRDSIQSHQKFADRQGLKIILLSDPEREVLEAYGAWRLKKRYGKESWGVARSTFLIDPEGKITRAWPAVSKAAGHAVKVLEELKKAAA